MPSLAYSIDPISPDQAAFAVSALLAELAPDFDQRPATHIATATDLLNAGLCLGFAATDETGLVGAILANPCAAIYAGGRFGEITELWVRPDGRSQGIAAALIARMTKEARSRGWKRLEVGAPSQPEWARSLAFYKRRGFAETGPRLRLLL